MSAAHRAASHSSSDQPRSSTATPPVPLHVVAGRLRDDPKTILCTYAHLLPHSDEMAAETSPPRSLTSR